MCGIAGFLTHNFPEASKEHLLAMGNTIAHRGPDAHGEYIDDQVGLCHRRLSILDLSVAGNQPMYSPDQQVVIVFNGEIYNFTELRDNLEQEGVVFTSGTDTEAILHLYMREGTNCLEKLNGMFAFAIWDKRENSLFIARDRLGKKPLYYLEHDDRFAFASEIKAILSLPNVPRDIRLDAVHDFFAYQYIPDPKSIFSHIHKLPPAHFMLIKDGHKTITKYWDLDFSRTSQKNESELKAELQTLINAATKRRMLSDVPLGAFLSGGVDSSGVVATMAKASQEPVKTCTIAFDDKKFNEAEFAASVAKQYNTEHHEFMVSQNVKESLEGIVAYFDEPFADPSLVPTFFVSELARQAVTVAIAGDGGDEVFAGYEKYHTDDLENKLRQKFPNWMRKKIFPPLANFFAKSELTVFRKAKSLLTSLSVSPEYGFYMTNSQMEDRQWQALINDETRQALGDYHPSTVTLDFYNSANGSDHLSKILYTDVKTYLTGGILVKVDRMSMANSLEVRAPILDREILEFAATVPSILKFNKGEKKYLLKEAFKEDLSDDILYRKKMGFSVPLADWFKNEIKESAQYYLIDQVEGLAEVFKLEKIKEYWQQHQQGQADHSAILWSMLMYEMWWHRYIKNA
ncbi:asparagine synthase (glutamine-hydrolyzing) [Glaciecola petra]|uniref:asparagine synthase (glutamine-hydrolyzing) n=1 Tax=Glaciecola petra TaxID=3075602 RepID=A0ABU2ZQ66_9ALTE|nr:asparagine synthase (glutamine-hydrolyzing) [Aestuariibacter sp. P117]MDT0593602.1 asparagine synthase (glutamine-hydrolyzing) [Aestuariibacter sp. P117]